MEQRVKEYITRFRQLSGDLQTLNGQLDTIREQYNTVDAEHSTRLAEWEAEQAGLQAAIDEAIEQEAIVALDAEEKESNAEMLLGKTKERQKKNEEYTRTLTRHRKSIEQRSAELESRDAEIKNRLFGFRDARDATRQQLLSTISEMEAALPKMAQDHSSKKEELQRRIDNVERTIVDENHKWSMGVAQRERADKKRLVALLNEEAQLAAEGHSAWSEMLRTGVPASTVNETAKEFTYMRHKLQAAAA